MTGDAAEGSCVSSISACWISSIGVLWPMR